MDEKSILKELADAVVACDPPRAKRAAETALSEGMDPVRAINEGLVVGMGVIGDNYAERKMYLPQVLVHEIIGSGTGMLAVLDERHPQRTGLLGDH